MIRASNLLPKGAPRLGFGCSDLWGGTYEPASVRLVETAFDAGVRWFDVARMYGDGTSEEVLGRVLPRVRDKVILVSKAGIMPWSMRLGARALGKACRIAQATPLARRFAPAPPEPRERFGAFSPAELARSVEHSLKALRTDYLDVLLLHECRPAEASWPETLHFLEKLRAEGKVCRFGVATGFPETLAILDRTPEVAGVAQFASDAFNHNVETLPGRWNGMVAVHTVLRQALPQLMGRLAEDPAAAARFVDRTGISPRDRSAVASLLLAEALAANPYGVVLFSTSKPERIAEALARVRTVPPTAVAALRAEIRGMQAPRPAPAGRFGVQVWSPTA